MKSTDERKMKKTLYNLPSDKVRYCIDIIKGLFESPLYKNAFHLITGAGLASILGFLFWFIATKICDQYTIGLSSAILSILGLFAIIAELGFGIGLIRFLPGAGKDENSLINTCFTISGVFSVLLAMVFIIGLPVWGQTLIPFFNNPVFTLLFSKSSLQQIYEFAIMMEYSMYRIIDLMWRSSFYRDSVKFTTTI